MPIIHCPSRGQAPEIFAMRLNNDVSDYLLADRGYDSDSFREQLIQTGTEPVIPSKKNRKKEIKYDKHIYKEKNFIERFFNRIKHFRRIATRAVFVE